MSMSASRVTALALVLSLLVTVGLIVREQAQPDTRELTATFTSTVNLYEGADVKVLGVPVGEVTDVRVDGTAVTVQMTYEDDVSLPENVHALIVPPSIVGDRFVQLAPAYSGEGPTLADGASLGLDRSDVPVELDDTYRQLTALAAALGPNGVNADGSLSRLVSASAATLDGNGARFHRTIERLGAALDTMAAADPAYQATVSNARDFTRTLKSNDTGIRRLVVRLAQVSGQLNRQRADIARATMTMSDALDDLSAFVRNNRGRFRESVESLRSVSGGLTHRIRDLRDLLALAPVGFVSAMNINLPSNWDFERPRGSRPLGRTTSFMQRGIFTNNVGVQVSSLLVTVCENATGPAATRLGDFCDAFAAAGYDLGRLVSELQSMQDERRAGSFSMGEVLRRLRQEAGR